MGMVLSTGSTGMSRNDGHHLVSNSEQRMVRYRPEGLDELCRLTKFTRNELQVMYRGFKNECPNGVLDEDTFKNIYSQFFPQGDSSCYAHHVFRTFDRERCGLVTFKEFVTGLSVLLRGSQHEKLMWTFRLYDVNGDEIVTREEMCAVVSAIYDMIHSSSSSSSSSPPSHVMPMDQRTSTIQHVDQLFQKMDLNRDGVISLEEFMEACIKDDNITSSLTVFETKL